MGHQTQRGCRGVTHGDALKVQSEEIPVSLALASFFFFSATNLSAGFTGTVG